MSKTSRKWILAALITIFWALLAVSVRHNIAYQLGNRPDFSLSKRVQRTKNGILVFSFHRVLNPTDIVKFDEKVSPNTQFHDFNENLPIFKQQMNYLHTHHVKVISIKQMIAMAHSNRPIRGKYVVITFDDIDRTSIDNAYPVLKKLHYPFTQSIITGNTGWYKQGTKLATWPAIQKLHREAGNQVTFGVHTNRMHYLVDGGIPVFNVPANFSRFKRDYATSQDVLKEKIGYKSPIFTYPYGSGNFQVQKFLDTRPGLKVVLTLNDGIVTNHRNLKQTPRIVVNTYSWPSIKAWINN